jgi:hypothetical protein
VRRPTGCAGSRVGSCSPTAQRLFAESRALPSLGRDHVVVDSRTCIKQMAEHLCYGTANGVLMSLRPA